MDRSTRINGFGMSWPQVEEKIHEITGTGIKNLEITTNSDVVRQDLIVFANNNEASIEIQIIDHGWLITLGIGEVSEVKLPHSDKSSVPEDVVSDSI